MLCKSILYTTLLSIAFSNHVYASESLITYSSNGELFSSGKDDPAIILESKSKGVAWIASTDPLVKDFNIDVNVSGIEASNGGYQFRLTTLEAITAKGIGENDHGLSIAYVYFAAKHGKLAHIYITYRSAQGELCSFDRNGKWSAGWKPTVLSWDSKRSYRLSARRTAGEIIFRVSDSQGNQVTSAPIDSSTIKGGMDPCNFMLGDAMTLNSGGTMTVNAVTINSNSVDLKQATVGLPVKRRLLNGLPYNGLFTFEGHQGYLQIPENYDQNKKHPFMLFFHGRGGSARNHNFGST
ncbi:hypothetical protein Pla110_18290 [Polystyrenella longa]|uniref:Uncharacterized protein n=1 Tax=Polystyrenella longa TaxID=2528007 RepID=A0A518CLL1_9PLAN|nr:hypothetical protein [Polystyrenella longa]QDU80107.1 hypothetical protein Pla110_18290 [Polystyrenella longa]